MGVDDVGFVDHHCHGVVAHDLDRPGFERMISESFDPPPEGTTQFDSPFGLAVRRWCAPVLDLEPFASPDEYLRRRTELGADEVARRFLAEAGLESLLIDTGYRSQELHDLDGMRRLSGRPVHEIVRLEAVAERVAVRGIDASSYEAAFAEALEAECRDAVGLKTIVAYRGGFGFDPEPPSGLDVTGAAGAFLRQASNGRPRLADPVLLRFGIWTGARLAKERGFPIQFHVGWGDPDLTLHLTNPSLLTDLIKTFGKEHVNVVLLHCYPFHRVAGYLASMFANVHFDVGSALHFHGPSSATLLAEAMEVAPFSKLLFSSDAFGVAEGYHLGALLHRKAMRGLLDRWIGDDHCDAATADRIGEAVAGGNARRIYPVPASG
jgi:uncharacterized protein